ncbi:hypothetical protein F5B22DRAFT_429157 [Xylaria bambusicola]|uniref:uncharacterized protein n=1 Tax=Xylaria bambusicola TaxID=326684 RepID=UPI002008BF86|nr:uncharacterized protein F5B22DRAFT_429157 [Xylaria bambusicola]KAI0506940.1 hypothetical protein F5B22DRAFT_429157 [Xylaria bambusicola]
MSTYNTTTAPSSPSSGLSAPTRTPQVRSSRQGTRLPTTQRSQIPATHINMDESTYMSPKAAHIHNELPGGSPPCEEKHSPTPPPTSTYGSQDMTRSYSSVPPYSPYSVSAYESSLPTPVSVAGSPSATERSGKMLSTYNQQGGAAQQLTPPATSRPWSYTSDMTSTSSAPMTVPTTAAEMLDIDSLESSHSPEHHTTVVDSAPHFHWGTYGVSSHDSTEEMSPQLPYSTVPPSLLIRSPSYGVAPSTHVPLTPALSQVSMPPHPVDTRTLMASDLHHQYSNLSHIALEFGASYPSRRSKTRTNRSNRSVKRCRNIDPSLSKNNGIGYNSENPNVMTGTNAPELPPPQQLTLDPKAPEDSRFLVDLRCQLSDDKGKGMWEQIQQAYKEHYGHKTKENLQMQLIRTVQSYAEWPESEDQALKEAAEEYERRRYPEIRKIMKEKGGRRVWDWNDGSIAKRLVQMGVDEIDQRDPIKRTRRKRKSTVRQKSGGEPWVGCVNIQYNPEPRQLSVEEDEMLLEAFCKTEPESPRPEHVPEHRATSCTGGDKDTDDDPSARVAKQACDQMLSERGERFYNGQNRYMA